MEKNHQEHKKNNNKESECEMREEAVKIAPGGGDGEEVEVHLNLKARSMKLQTRRILTSSRASSLFDAGDEEDEGETEEPGLEVISDDENESHSSTECPSSPSPSPTPTSSSSSSSSVASFSLALVKEEPPSSSRLLTMESPLARLAEGMACYLCPGGPVDDAEFALKVSSNRELAHSAGHFLCDFPCGVSPSSCVKPAIPLCSEASSFAQSNTTRTALDHRSHQQQSQQQQQYLLSTGCAHVAIHDLQHVMINNDADGWLSSFAPFARSPTTGFPVPPCQKPLNRSGNRKRRKQRLQLLWNKWHTRTPFMYSHHQHHSSSSSSSASSFYTNDDLSTLGQTKSFNDKPTPIHNNNNVVSSSQVSDLFYDSEPEAFLRSQKIPRHHRQRRSTQQQQQRLKRQRPRFIDTSASYASCFERPLPPRNPTAPRHLPSFGSISSFESNNNNGRNSSSAASPLHTPRSTPHVPIKEMNQSQWSEIDEKLFVKDLMLGKINLRYHPHSRQGNQQENNNNNKRSPSSPTFNTPVSVEGWFEMGSRLRSKIVHPKFMWKECFQAKRPGLFFTATCTKSKSNEKTDAQKKDSNDDKTTMKNVNGDGTTRFCNSIDVLAMVRILVPTHLDREAYPYAKLDRTFVIHSQSGDKYVFECFNTQERDWFVYGLKLAVSRLASMIIVGHEQMFLEFFSPWAYIPIIEDGEESTLDSDEEDDDEDEEDDDNNDTKKKRDAHRRTGGVNGRPSKPIPFFVSTTDEDRASLWGTTKPPKGR